MRLSSSNPQIIITFGHFRGSGVKWKSIMLLIMTARVARLYLVFYDTITPEPGLSWIQRAGAMDPMGLEKAQKTIQTQHLSAAGRWPALETRPRLQH